MPTRLALALLTALAALVGATSAAAATSAEQQLAERFAPVAELRVQSAECDRSGEAYPPAPVETVLDNPEVVLRGPGKGGPIVKRAPSAADLYGVGEDYYLDFPGDPRRPGCRYETDFRRFGGERPNVAYAHIARQADAPGKLALQYWLWSYFNDFNNTHESDWEMIQLVFDADTAEEALAEEPVEVGYAQHSGGERSAWDDAKLRKVGDRPVISTAAGSHASFYSPRLYLGRSASEGFGCDETRPPSRRVMLEPRLLPDAPSGPEAPDAWLGFAGHWGELQPPPYDGPTGPSAKRQWTRPIEWQDDLRDGSVTVPTDSAVGPTVSGFFCGAVARGSQLVLAIARAPVITLSLLGVILIGGGIAARRARWSLRTAPPLVERRAGGETLRAALRLYRDHPLAFLGTGLAFLPLGIVAAGIQAAIMTLSPVENLVSLAGSHSAVAGTLALMVGGVGNLIGLMLVACAVAGIVSDIEQGRTPTARRAWGAVWARLGDIVRTVGRGAVLVVVLLASLVGIPWGVARLVRWLVAPQVVMLEGRTGRDALERSAELVRDQPGSVALRSLTANAAGLLIAPLLAAPLLFLTALPLSTINLVGSLIYVIVIPVVGATMALVYGDLRAREQERAAEAAAGDAGTHPDQGKAT